MFSKVLVPLDGSELGDRALPYGETLARVANGSLLLVRATDAMTLDEEEQLELVRDAQTSLTGVARRLMNEGVSAIPHVYSARAASAILDAATAHEADLIVMSTHGRSGLGRWAYGSVTEHVLRAAGRPVLIIPPHCTQHWKAPCTTILVPLDGSTLAEAALEPAVSLAVALGTGVLLINVIEPPNPTLQSTVIFYPPRALIHAWADESRHYMDQLADRLRTRGLKTKTEVAFGHPATTICRMAREHHADAIVMATHGRTGLARAFMGSVASGVIPRADVPLLVVRSPVKHEAAPGTLLTRVETRAGLALNGQEIDLMKEGLELLIAARREEGLVDSINHLLHRLELARASETPPDQAALSQAYSA